MQPKTLAALRRGIEVGLVASVPQVLGTYLQVKAFGLPEGSANIGPRFIQRLGRLTRQRLSEEFRWLGASAFHFGYAASWGALYAAAYERRPVHPLLGGLILAGTIYSVAFTNWGVATRTRTERPHRHRDWRREIMLISPPLIFGLGTAILYGRGPRPGEEALAGEILNDPLRQREPSRRRTPRRPEETRGQGAPRPPLHELYTFPGSQTGTAERGAGSGRGGESYPSSPGREQE